VRIERSAPVFAWQANPPRDRTEWAGTGRDAIKGMTKFELTVSGLSLLALISYLTVFRAHTDRPKPVVVAHPLQTSAKVERQKRDLPKSGRRVRVSETPVPANQVATARDTISSEESDAAAEGEAAIPVAFVELSPELNSSEGQPAEIDFLRQQFVELMGGADQDPASPEYRRRWDEVQRQIDEEFMAFFGQEAFNEQQVKAVRAAGEASGS
jgi:hypothetical protein